MNANRKLQSQRSKTTWEQKYTTGHKQTNTDTKTTIRIFLAEWNVIHKALYPLAMTCSNVNGKTKYLHHLITQPHIKLHYYFKTTSQTFDPLTSRFWCYFHRKLITQVKSFAAAYTNGTKESYLTALFFRVTFGLGPLSRITLNPDVFVLAFCLYAGMASSEVTEAYVRNDQC